MPSTLRFTPRPPDVHHPRADRPVVQHDWPTRNRPQPTTAPRTVARFHAVATLPRAGDTARSVDQVLFPVSGPITEVIMPETARKE
jgi:hypothetical protein